MVLPGSKVRVEPFGDLDASDPANVLWAGLDSSDHPVTKADLSRLVTEINEYLNAPPPSS